MASACGPGASRVNAWVTGCSSIMTVDPRGRPISRTPPLSSGPTTSGVVEPVAVDESFDGGRVAVSRDVPPGFESFGTRAVGPEVVSVGGVSRSSLEVVSNVLLAATLPDANP